MAKTMLATTAQRRRRQVLFGLCAFVSLWLIILIRAVTGAVLAAEKTIKLPDDNALAQLKPGPNVEIVRANCVTCHSTDYIVLQPRGDAKHWEGEVQKMIMVYGAPISEADASAITEYLGTVYGESGRKAQTEEKGKRKL